jgi:hypothetical protein
VSFTFYRDSVVERFPRTCLKAPTETQMLAERRLQDEHFRCRGFGVAYFSRSTPVGTSQPYLKTSQRTTNVPQSLFSGLLRTMEKWTRRNAEEFLHNLSYQLAGERNRIISGFGPASAAQLSTERSQP